MIQYIEQFNAWYNNLSDAEYIAHYNAWCSRDVAARQKEVILELIGDKHYGAVYDLSYGGGELSHIIDHDWWLKSAIDDRQQSLIESVAPAVDIKRIETPLGLTGLTRKSLDLVLAVNVTRNISLDHQSYPSLRKLWDVNRRERDAIFDVIISDDPWVGMNDAALSTSFLGFADNYQMLPRLYWEFPAGVKWYMCYYSANEMNWLPGGRQAFQNEQKDISPSAVHSVVEKIYSDISDKHILDLSAVSFDILNLPTIHEHYDVVLGLGLLSRIEQYGRFVQRVIRHINADTYIFSGTEAEGKIPEMILQDGVVSSIEHTYRHFSRLKRRIEKEFNCNAYLVRGPSPKESTGVANDAYIVVEANYQLRETIVKTALLKMHKFDSV